VQALAQAAWRQDWPPRPPAVEGPIGGYPLVRAAAAIEGAAEPSAYRDQRCGLTGYRLRVPKGRYTVTLRFAELERTRAGERVFDVVVEDRLIVDHQNIPCLAAIEVVGSGTTRRVNVGGPAVAGYEADLAGVRS
jgi:beta-galactosidase